MRRLRGLPRRFRFPWRTAIDIRREVDAELSFHLDLRIEELEWEGLTSEDARREALSQFGDYDYTRRLLTNYGRRGERMTRRRTMFEDLLRDTRYAWRSLAKSPGFTAVAVVVLALGIGVNSAAFSLINLLVVRPLMIEKPEELAGVYSQNMEREDRYRAFSYPEYLDLREATTVFSELAAHTITVVGVAEAEVTRRVMAGIVSANFFRTFGVPLARGREFDPEEERPGGRSAVAIVSHDFWERRGRDPELVGSTFRINGEIVEVIGVAAEGFTGSTAIFSPDLWFPLGFYERTAGVPAAGAPPSLDDRRNFALMLFGRRHSGVSSAQVETELKALAARLAETHPATEDERHAYLTAPLPRLSISNVPDRENYMAAPTMLLAGMSGIVLLIACLNLANMFLARGASRHTEMAIRQSLGCGRARLVRQLLAEGLVLALAGGAAGLLLANWGTRWLLSSIGSLVPLGISLQLDVRPDLWVILATAAASIFATLLFGLGPAWKLTRGDLTASLKEGTGGDVDGGFRSRSLLAPRSLLIVAQVALSLVLLTAGGLFTRGALAAARATPGFSLDASLLVELDPSLLGYGEERTRDVYRQVVDRVRSLPEVENAALASIVPFGAVTSTRSVQAAGPEDPDSTVSPHYYVVGDDYFAALRLPIRQGRGFTAAEASSASGTPVAIIDEPLAERLFPETGALGRQVQMPRPDPDAEPIVMEVVGVVPGTRHNFWDQTPPPHLYVPFGQRFIANMHVHVRVSEAMAEPSTLLETIRGEIRAIDPALPVLGLKTMLDHRDESLFLWLVRAGGKLFSVLGILALFLALVGVYGVKAFMMARRTREIGVRMALGATHGDVLRQMVREGLALTAAGLALGLLLAMGVARLLGSLLYEVSAGDPLVFAGSTVLLAAAATLASYLPARRATRIEPTVALRHD